MSEGQQRKLAAILVADVVGYSRHVETDEEAAIAELQVRREAIHTHVARHHGRVFGGAGDSVIAEFDSPVETVRCAVAIQQYVRERNAELPEQRRMHFRIGINLGDVIVDGDDLLGDGVNVAARLESIAGSGEVCISRTVYDQVHKQLPFGFEALGRKRLKNIDEPVTVYRVEADPTSPNRSLPQSKRGLRPRQLGAVAAVVLILVVGAGVWWLVPGADVSDRSQFHLPDRPSVAVLPFDSFSHEEEQGFLADGVTEDIITQLARNSELTVMARTATFAFKGSGLSAKEIADRLNVHYVLEGSVRRVGDRLRISAQLIDSKTGNHVWAENYDSAAEAVFQTQDNIVANIVGLLFSEIRETEKNKILRRPPNTLDVYETTLRGVALKHKLNPEDSRRAREVLKRAVEMDPNYAPAWLYLGWVEGIAIAFRWIEGLGPSHLKDAIGKIEKAIELDPTLATAYQALGILKSWEGDAKGALQAAKRSVELGPGDADNLLFFGRALASVGAFDEAVASARRAVALNPSRPIYYDAGLSRVLWGQGSYDEAGNYANDCLTRAPGYMQCLIFLIASNHALKDATAAAKALADLRRYSPGLTVTDAVNGVGFPGDAKANARLAEQLAAAGVPADRAAAKTN